jgi:hypothetical protein
VDQEPPTEGEAGLMVAAMGPRTRLEVHIGRETGELSFFILPIKVFNVNL